MIDLRRLYLPSSGGGDNELLYNPKPNTPRPEGALPTEPRIPEGELRACVARLIDGGRLPLTVPPQVSAGYGAGDTLCDVCDHSVEAHDVAYEVVDPATGNRLMFHFGCYVAWQRECTARLSAMG